MRSKKRKKKKKKKKNPSRSKLAGMTKKRSKTVFTSVMVHLKKKNQLSTKINKIPHYCNFPRIFFRLCVKEAVVAATFMFELNIFRIFATGNDTPFSVLYLSHKEVYPMPSVI